jgi:hypothetical protein
MMAESAFARINALDLSRLTEIERQAATVEVRGLLDAIAESGKHDVRTLTHKVALLKIWQKLVHMRVVDVARNVPPPKERPETSRLFPDAPLFDAPEGEAAEQASAADSEHVDNGLLLVRTLMEGVVQGMRLPAGVTVETSEADAASLVSSGLGMIIQRSDIRPDEEVTRTQKA